VSAGGSWRKTKTSMSTNRARFNSIIARAVADELAGALAPRCERIEIAGSLRRGKPDVGDIEILYVPREGQIRVPGELFPKKGWLVDELLEQWLAKGVLTKRPNKNGVTSWGEDNKFAIHGASGVPVDLFSSTAEGWFVKLVVRTGSYQTNIRLAASAKQRGFHLDVSKGRIARAGTYEVVFPQSEREVFELCGVAYREPAER
jgi:DNA polymerase/3'-5' exonuclease PolX